jgi:uncharacterized repeat protein (TIGR03847 family)
MSDSPLAHDLDPVSFITLGTVGPPGQRMFFLQAAQSRQVVSLIVEKEQAVALAASIERLLASLKLPGVMTIAEAEALSPTMDLLQPVEPAFRVVEMGLGVDEDREAIVLMSLEAPDDEPGQRVRFVANYDQMRRLARRTIAIVEQGRPVCPLCGRPIGPEGHFCPRTNGHASPPPGP